MTDQLSAIEKGIVLSKPSEVLKSNGKSFYFASLIFSEDQMARVSTLYAICRYIDDCADEHAPLIAREKLSRVQSVLSSVQQKTSPVTLESEDWLQKKVREVESWGVSPLNLQELLKGALQDLDFQPIKSESELYQYCYLVAGVVGVMMCPLIGVREREAYPHAVDLGIAMQLTNICRDVKEDYENGRTYLPELKESGQIEFGSAEVVKKYLDIADLFYVSGYRGLAYIPLRARIVILLAGEVYRAIGTKIRKNQYQVWKGRTYLSIFEKIIVAVKTLRFFFKREFWHGQPHKPVCGFVWSAQ